MSKVIFIFNQVKTEIQCNENEIMRNICSRYASKIGKDLNSFYFIYSGINIDLNLTFKNVINSLDSKKKCFTLLVNSFNTTIIEGNNLIKESQIICPQCSEIATIEIQNYKIKLTCKKGHMNKILISQYENTQKIDQSRIICEICNKNNKASTYNNMFFRCNNCKKNICPLCKDQHDKSHDIINYNDKNYICEDHSERYYSYCKSCKKNLCTECEKYHNGHAIITYGNLIQEKSELRNNLDKFKNAKDNFNKVIKDLKDKLDKVMENIETLYKIDEDMINHYISSKSNRNYELLMNIRQLNSYENIIKEMNQIINNKNNNLEISNILNIYDKMISEEDNNKFQNFEDLNKKIKELKKENDNLTEKCNKITELCKENDKLSKEKAFLESLNNELENSKPLFTIRSSCNENKCIDTKSLSYNENTQIWDYIPNNKNQIFELEKGSKNGFYFIKNHYSGYYLGMDKDDGLKICMRKKSETLQNFKFIDCKNGFYIIENESGYVADLGNWITDNGNAVSSCGKSGSSAQQWKLVLL